MDTVYIMHGTTLRREDNTLRVTLDSGRKVRLPVESLKHLVIPNACHMTSDVLAFLGQHQVRVSFLDYYGYHQASLEPSRSYDAGAVHLAQAQWILDESRRVSLARTLLKAAADSLIHNLQYYYYRGKPLAPFIERMQGHRQHMEQSPTIPSLMGSEGLLRQEYYAAWGVIHPSLTITRRSRRPPADRVNALISFGNGLMYSTCRQALSQSHLDPTLSVIHAPTQARSSLALDVAELFKPVIVDRLIFRWATRGELRDHYFDEHPGICLLTSSGRDAYVEAYRHDLDITSVDQMTGYGRVILREVYRLEAHLLNLAEYHPFVRRT